MANKRITELPSAGTITGSELVAVVQTGETRKTNVTSLLTPFLSNYVGFSDLNSGTISPTFNTIKLSSNPIVGTPAVGEFYYDVTEQTATLNLGATSLQVGQELYVRVRNMTGSTIPNGTVVYINGATSGRPTIAKAQSNSDITSTTVIGVATQDILDNTVGSVTINGVVNGLDTSAYNEGTMMYLSASVAGSYISTVPVYPNRLIEVGRVIKQHSTDGQLLVKIVVDHASYLKGELGVQGNNSLGSALIGYTASLGYPTGTVGHAVDNKLDLTGGTLTGSLILSNDAGSDLEPVTKRQFDTGLNSKANKGLVTASGLTSNTSKLLGRSTAGAGNIEEIALSSRLTLAGGVLDTNITTDHGIALITSSGTFTIPSNSIRVSVVGGAGGGGGSQGVGYGAGGGGGLGGFGVKYITGLTVGSTVIITIGSGGSAGASTPTAGGSGGTTSFGSYLTSTGGSGGGASTGSGSAGSAGSTGTATGADFTPVLGIAATPGIAASGGKGGDGGYITHIEYFYPANGTITSNRGVGATMPGSSGVNGGNGSGYSAGGGGGASYAWGAAGGTGTGGFIVVEW